MKIDLHNHTTLCNHSTGSMEEYVQKAIEQKIDIFGFSDHAPMNFDKEYRMSFEQMNWYESEVLRLENIYKSDIDLMLAYEVDYLPGFMDNRVLKSNVDYLIGSVHFINEWGFDNPEFIGKYKNTDIDDIWQQYFDLVEEMANSGLFNIVGHIDLIKVFNFLPKKDIKLIAQKAIKAIKKNNLVVEINSAGERKPIHEIYPSNDILEMLLQEDIAVTFGSDAHKISEVGYKLEENMKYIKSFGFSKIAYFKSKEKIFI